MSLNRPPKDRKQSYVLSPDDEALAKAIISSQKIPPTDPRVANHLTLYHFPKPRDSNAGFFKVKIPGGGNCGFYSIALGIINLIIRDELTLSDLQYSRLIRLLKEKSSGQKIQQQKARNDVNVRLNFYETGDNPRQLKPPRLEKCVPYIKDILAEIDNGDLETFDQFKKNILQKMKFPNEIDYFLESMMIVLGPALREISVLEYNSLKNAKFNVPEQKYSSKLTDVSDIDIQAKDGENTSEEQLNLLAGFFEFKLYAFNQTHKKKYYGSFAGSEAAFAINHPIALTPEPQKPNIEIKSDSGSGFVNDKSPDKKLLSLSKEECDKYKIETNIISIIYNLEANHWDLLLPEKALLRPCNLFLNLRSLMVQNAVSLAIMKYHSYESSLKEANQGTPVFDSDSYLLVFDDKKDNIKKWQLIYIDNRGNHNSIEITKIKGLDDTLNQLTQKNHSDIELSPEIKANIKRAITIYQNGGSLPDAKFDEKELSVPVKELIDKLKNRTQKVNELFHSVDEYEKEIKLLQNSAMKTSGITLISLIRNYAINILDESIDENERLKHYKLITNELSNLDNCKVQMPPALKNKYIDVVLKILYILANIATLGVIHSIYCCFFKEKKPSAPSPEKLNDAKLHVESNVKMLLDQPLQEKLQSTDSSPTVRH